MYVSFWNADDYFMLNENEFDERLTGLEMVGIEVMASVCISGETIRASPTESYFNEDYEM